MEVIWKGSIELQDGTNKVTLEIPQESLDEFDNIKREIRHGKKVGLVVMTEDTVTGSPYDAMKQAIMARIDDLIEAIKVECKPGLLKEKEGENS